LVLPNSTLETLSSPRFDSYRFIFPEYISLFLNADKIGPQLRNILLGSLAKVQLTALDEQSGRILKNPFFTDESVLPTDFDPTKIESLMKSLGYFKKEALLLEVSKPKVETKTPTETTSFYFTSPSNKKYSVTKENDILISGNTPDGVTGVYINDYRLKTYTSKEKKFYYRAKTDIGTLKNGLNTYSLAFEIGGRKVQKEAITIFLATTQEEALAKEKEYNTKIVFEKNNTVVQEQKQKDEKQVLTKKIEPLDPVYYYDKNLKKFTLNFVYTKQTPYMETLAKEIANHIQTLGINVQTTPLTTEDLQQIISKGEKQYSMILTGINL
jgi:hypothetical protein